MSLTYIGELTLAVAMPAAFDAALAGAAAINLGLPELNAQLAAFAAFTPLLGNFAADIALANSIIAAINAAIAAGIGEIGLDVQVAIVAALVLDLEAILLQINLNLTLILNFISLVAAGGVHAYAYDGQVGAFGVEVTAALSGGVPGGGGPTEHCNALVLATTIGATWTVMGQVFKVTP